MCFLCGVHCPCQNVFRRRSCLRCRTCPKTSQTGWHCRSCRYWRSSRCSSSSCRCCQWFPSRQCSRCCPTRCSYCCRPSCCCPPGWCCRAGGCLGRVGATRVVARSGTCVARAARTLGEDRAANGGNTCGAGQMGQAMGSAVHVPFLKGSLTDRNGKALGQHLRQRSPVSVRRTGWRQIRAAPVHCGHLARLRRQRAGRACRVHLWLAVRRQT